MQPKFFAELITPASIIFGVVFGAEGRVKELQSRELCGVRVDGSKLRLRCKLIETRTHVRLNNGVALRG